MGGVKNTSNNSSHSSSPEKSSSEKMASSPPSSPPGQGDADGDVKMEDEMDHKVSETMRQEEQRMADLSRKEDQKRERDMAKERQKDREGGKDALDKKFTALEYLLSQSKLYSTIMLAEIQKQEEKADAKTDRDRKKARKREDEAEKAAVESQRRTTRRGAEADTEKKNTQQSVRVIVPKLKKQQSGKITDFVSKESLQEKAGKGSIQDALQEEVAQNEEDGVKAGDIGIQNLRSARQPDLVTGGTMRGYQLEGLEWLTSLYENGLNGILADEMGLGKTVQTISFLSFLREKGVNGPFLIAAPLSTTSNWVDEFKGWTPSIPVVLYHGSKDEREEIRRKQLKNPGSASFPVVCTSYEICMNDRKFLANYGWKYIIIDEGHRIKNLNCRLIRELQSYQSANRLLITGTPLQNNLAELWSLLHFLMPEIFDKLESFESWFDFSALKERGGHEQLLSENRKKSLVSSLHAILKPFLLRRVKTDVEQSLPKKREYILYAPLTQEQRELYQAILDGDSRSYLEDKVVETLSRNVSGASTPLLARGSKRKSGASGASTPASKSAKTSRASTPATNGSITGRRSKRRQNYSEISDTAYFKSLENGSSPNGDAEEDDADEESDLQRQQAKTFAQAKKMIAQKKLSNPIMQLRLCCNSPHNFYDPFPSAYDENFDESKLDYSVLVSASGKMQLLDRLLRGLLDRKDPATGKPAMHKILIFSQFKTQLDLIGLYLEEVLGHSTCRIDGSIANADRREQIHLFNESDDYRIFLLSTRAGGQGINLAAADTVILFDSDWNPQQDLQAQDRAHRIGQRRNVIVYRLASRGTVEEMLLEKADGKRRLEKLVIQKGRFKSWTERARGRKSGGSVKAEDDDDDDDDEMDSLEELRGLLGRDDGEKYDFDDKGAAAAASGRAGKKVLSDKDLATLTDRSEEAYERAEKGEEKTSAAFKGVETKRDGDGLLESMAR